MVGLKGGVSHISSGPAGTTSQWPCKMRERPVSCSGRIVPTTVLACEKSCSGCPKSGRSLTVWHQFQSSNHPRYRPACEVGLLSDLVQDLLLLACSESLQGEASSESVPRTACRLLERSAE